MDIKSCAIGESIQKDLHFAADRSLKDDFLSGKSYFSPSCDPPQVPARGLQLSSICSRAGAGRPALHDIESFATYKRG